ncbi:MAG TPA: SUMF1/EgtB/PvdO family nonheme iron enzyme [Isosphaeraceae bacterium]|nr:SUMF1/EgtB/PvdO family nonheme iron enzyme [Isosphaeraceae bacterium]
MSDWDDLEDQDEDELLPRAPQKPPAPLPRIQYVDANAPPEAAQAEAELKAKPKEKHQGKKESKAKQTERSDKPEPKGKRKKGQGKDGEKPALIEETPELDTYEARQKARIIVGSLVALVFLGLGLMVWSWLSPAAEDTANLPDEGKLMAGAMPGGTAVDPGKAEREASQMFAQARLTATHGNTPGAISLLEKVKTTYPQTPAAKDAQEALDRPKQGLPLFVDGPAVAAKHTEPAPAPVDPPKAIVSVHEAQPTAPVTGQSKVDAQIVPPSSPAEPRAPGAGNAQPAAAGVVSRPLPAGFRARAEAGVHASGWPLEIVGDRDGATLVLVPGGSFTMGRDDGPPSEGPPHQVSLSTYYIDQHEVTVRQYARYLQETGRKSEAIKGVLSKDSGSPDPAENRPIVRVNANEAGEFARWAGKALPTEAQWEMAARTPDGRLQPWGNSPPPWGRSRAYRQIDPVMSFPGDLSPYGAYDLAGNAFEWTADWFDPKYFQQFRTAPASNPIGPARSKSKPPQVVIKGGSKSWECAWREGMKADARMDFIGFRCALTVETAAPMASEPATNPPSATATGPATPAPANQPPPSQGGVVPF